MSDETNALLIEARSLVGRSQRIVVLTGAGISAESGIPTFRGAGGIWNDMRVEDVATPEGFARDPLTVWNWYADRRADLERAAPNPAHVALAEIQQLTARREGSFVLATQNIDGLHQAAGSTGVLELHGSMRSVRCQRCAARGEMTIEHVDQVPRCTDCGAGMRPDVVWFGEAPPQEIYLAAVEAAGQCDLFMTVGTSATVYPAAGLIEWALSAGAKTVEVNLEPTPASRLVSIALHGKAGRILPQLVAPPGD